MCENVCLKTLSFQEYKSNECEEIKRLRDENNVELFEASVDGRFEAQINVLKMLIMEENSSDSSYAHRVRKSNAAIRKLIDDAPWDAWKRRLKEATNHQSNFDMAECAAVVKESKWISVAAKNLSLASGVFSKTRIHVVKFADEKLKKRLMSTIQEDARGQYNKLIIGVIKRTEFIELATKDLGKCAEAAAAQGLTQSEQLRRCVDAVNEAGEKLTDSAIVNVSLSNFHSFKYLLPSKFLKKDLKIQQNFDSNRRLCSGARRIFRASTISVRLSRPGTMAKKSPLRI